MLRPATILAAATLSALGAAYGVRLTHERQEAREALAAAEQLPALRQTASLTEPAPATGGVSAGVRKSDDGHYWAEAKVDGRHVRFLVDTGASTVALTAADAKRLGYDTRDLVFDQPVSTASGKTMAAAVTLDSVAVAGARIEDVEALVIEKGLETSLLGMTYLGRLSRFEATPQGLILRR